MKDRIMRLFLFLSCLAIIVCIPTIYFLGYKKIAIVLIIIILLIDILLYVSNDNKINYKIIKGHKAIIYADIGNYKLIKLYYGNKKARKLTNRVYDIIVKSVTNGCVNRRYQDRFSILVQYKNKNELIHLVNKINEEVHSILDDGIFKLTVKFGIQICIVDDYDSNEIKAEIACNKAKVQSMNPYYFYDEEDTETLLREKKVIDNLITSLKENDFKVYFQPKYDCINKKIYGSEALVRLIKDNKIVPAKDFIDVAEKYSFTVPLDKYVLRETCKYIKELKSKKIKFNSISVNVSRNTLCEEDMLEYYEQVLNEYDIKRDEIEFEVTERSSNESVDLSYIIHKLSKKFNVSIDDFGIGSSSLSMLSESKIKTIKIDRKFISDNSEQTRKILDNIIKLARSLDFEIIAEGVETKEQLEYLKKKGCNIIQGFYFYKPMPFEEYLKILEGEK